MEKNEKKKGFFTKLVEKADKKLKEKADKSCCCCDDDSENKGCC